MSELDPKTLIKKYLSETSIMQLATLRDNQPWVCSVHVAADTHSSLYWISKATSRHSQDIASNPFTAITVAVKTDRPLIGIQAVGTATMLSDPKKIKVAMDIYVEHHATDPAFADQIIAGTSTFKLYAFTPVTFQLYDELHFPHQAPKEWVIDSK